MQTVFFGTSTFAVPSLQALVRAGHRVVLCVTQQDQPRGRGLTPGPSPVKVAALGLGIPVAQPRDGQELLSACQAVKPELGVVASYGRLIPSQLLNWPIHGILGVHPSLLPRYRGASPIAWAILNGEQTTGVTVFRLNERMDAGDIVLQRALAIGPRETGEQLSGRLAALGAELLVDGAHQIAQKQAPFLPQDETRATSTTKLTKRDGRIEWGDDAETIDRKVRALNPWPGACTDWNGRVVRLWLTTPDARVAMGQSRPGEILRASAEGVLVATGRGVLAIHELQVAGGRRMGVEAFLAGHAVKTGDIVGE